MKDNKIIYIILAIVVLIGAVIIGVKGLNLDLKYSQSKQVDVYLGKEFDNKEIRNLVKEVIGNQEITVQKTEAYEEIASITVRDITDEQVEELNKKINENYKLENNVGENVIVNEIPGLNFKDLVKPYIFPVAFSIIIILVYAGIRFRNINVLEVIANVLAFPIGAEVLYISILAITRLPINVLTLPIAVAIFIIVMLVVISEFEIKEDKIIREQTKTKKRK